jgi:hypothetical protein
MALYQANSSCFVDVVLARLAAVPALRVRIVTDDEQCPVVMGARSCALSRLEGHPRVQIIDDGRTTLMHHKFIIADGARIWVASANMTRQSFCTDENNAIVIEDAPTIATYSAEFRRMFETRMFGPIAPEAEPSPAARFAVYFSPRSPSTMPRAGRRSSSTRSTTPARRSTSPSQPSPVRTSPTRSAPRTAAAFASAESSEPPTRWTPPSPPCAWPA